MVHGSFMTTLDIPSTNEKLPPVTKTPVVLITIRALIDQFGTLDSYQRKYGEIFYTRKSSLFPAYVIFSNPKVIEKT